MYIYYYHEKFKAVELACSSWRVILYILLVLELLAVRLVYCVRDWFRVHDVHVCCRLLVPDFQQMRAAVIHYLRVSLCGRA
jgi:hypothetical protein